MSHLTLPKGKRVQICGHINPDGDSLSCCTAIHNHYREVGVDARIFTYGEVAENLQFALKNVWRGDDPDRFDPDLIVIVDTCIDRFYNRRIGFDAGRFLERGKRVLCIDHHPIMNERTVDLRACNLDDIKSRMKESAFVSVCDPDQVSCASVLVKYFHFRDPVLYIGIRNDSGNFSRQTLAALEAVRHLDITEEMIEAYNQEGRPKPKSTQILEHIQKNGLLRFGPDLCRFYLLAIEEDSPNIAKSVLSILKQFYPNVGVAWNTGISLRSDNIDVRLIALDLGGGGHHGAAGSSNVSVRDLPFIGETITKHVRKFATAD